MNVYVTEREGVNYTMYNTGLCTICSFVFAKNFFKNGGHLTGGLLVRGAIGQGTCVHGGHLSGGNCPGGVCPGGNWSDTVYNVSFKLASDPRTHLLDGCKVKMTRQFLSKLHYERGNARAVMQKMEKRTGSCPILAKTIS